MISAIIVMVSFYAALAACGEPAKSVEVPYTLN